MKRAKRMPAPNAALKVFAKAETQYLAQRMVENWINTQRRNEKFILNNIANLYGAKP